MATFGNAECFPNFIYDKVCKWFNKTIPALGDARVVECELALYNSSKKLNLEEKSASFVVNMDKDTCLLSYGYEPSFNMSDHEYVENTVGALHGNELEKLF